MSRQVFLTIASAIAICVGLFALIFPHPLLESKGVQPLTGTIVWTRETGLLLLVMGIIAFLIRAHRISPTLKVFLLGNALIQIGLFAIELIAYYNGIITKAMGILPNLAIHILLAAGFLHYGKSIARSPNIN